MKILNLFLKKLSQRKLTDKKRRKPLKCLFYEDVRNNQKTRYTAYRVYYEFAERMKNLAVRTAQDCFSEGSLNSNVVNVFKYEITDIDALTMKRLIEGVMTNNLVLKIYSFYKVDNPTCHEELGAFEEEDEGKHLIFWKDILSGDIDKLIAYINLGLETELYYYVLTVCVMCNLTKSVVLLLDSRDAVVNDDDYRKHLPMYFASAFGCTESFKILVEYGFRTHVEYLHPFLLACFVDNTDICKLIVDARVDNNSIPDITNSTYLSCCLTAFINENVELIEYMYSHQLDFIPTPKNYVELSKNGEKMYVFNNFYIFFCINVVTNNMRTMEILMRKSAQIDVPNEFFTICASSGTVDMCKYVTTNWLQDVDIFSSALENAGYGGRTNMVKYLIGLGGDLSPEVLPIFLECSLRGYSKLFCYICDNYATEVYSQVHQRIDDDDPVSCFVTNVVYPLIRQSQYFCIRKFFENFDIEITPNTTHQLFKYARYDPSFTKEMVNLQVLSEVGFDIDILTETLNF